MIVHDKSDRNKTIHEETRPVQRGEVTISTTGSLMGLTHLTLILGYANRPPSRAR